MVLFTPYYQLNIIALGRVLALCACIGIDAVYTSIACHVPSIIFKPHSFSCKATPHLRANNNSAVANDSRSLSLIHLHTNEQITNIVYWKNGQYVEAGIKKISYLLRDHRTGEVRRYDPKVLDILYQLMQRTGTSKHFEIICGYRSRNSNEMLRNASFGVARESLHLHAKAIDLRLPGTPLKTLYKHARILGAGGVGLYTGSNFIHVDTGKVRSW